MKNQTPYEIFAWIDSEPTGATGWIVIDTIINGVAGGGLFMHKNANIDEVKDLAKTMSYKNTLQQPQFGGAKAGIQFDPEDPRADQVLERFLKTNQDVIANWYCTGADLNTSNATIHRIIIELL